MFKKEAEEIVKRNVCGDCNKCQSFGYIGCDIYRYSKDSCLYGLRTGYNKANEWHKQEVNDIYDLISEDWSIRYFICIMKDKSRVTAMGNCDEGCNGEVSVNLFFEHDDEKYYIDDIVWWKEIELPTEVKEND